MRLVLLLFLIVSCNNVENSESEDPDLIYKEISLQKILDKSFVDGCGCYFSTDSSEFAMKNYYLIMNYDSICMINIGGTDELLKSNATLNTVYPDNELSTFENQKYIVVVEIAPIKQNGDETLIYKGLMSITLKSNGEKYTKDIYGECGC